MSLNNTVASALTKARKLLSEKGITDAAFVARLFLSDVTSLSTAQLLAEGRRELSKQEEITFFDMINRRILGEPAQHILGKWEFMGLPFIVTKDVLIPRADTEILVETVLEKSNIYNIKEILDLGTGTGCIPISLAKHGNMNAVGVDISKNALDIAKENSNLNNIMVKWYLGDLFTALPNNYMASFDAIISNPPYIKTDEIQGLMQEVRCFEPTIALDGGDDGLDFYRKIAKNSPQWLKQNGWIFFEIGCTQAKEVAELLEDHFTDIEIIKDLAGLDRVVVGRRKLS